MFGEHGAYDDPGMADRLIGLIAQLPYESALARAVEPDWWWYRAEHEYLAQLIELTAMVNTPVKDRGKLKPLPRPGDKQRRATERWSWNDFDALMGGAPDA